MLITRTVTVTGSQEDRNQFLIMLTDVMSTRSVKCSVSEMGLQRFNKQTFSEYFDLNKILKKKSLSEPRTSIFICVYYSL